MTNLFAMTTFKERLRKAVAHSGLSGRELARRAGFRSETQISAMLSAKADPNPTNDTMQKLASVAGVSFEWLAKGTGPFTDDGAPEPSPSPPPADSDVRAKATASHWFPDEVEATFVEALQHPDAPRLAGPSAAVQLAASKVTYRDRATNLTPDVAVEFCVQLLWAAKRLDEAGALGDVDDEATKGALISEVIRRGGTRIPSTRPGAGASAEVLTSRARADMEAQGIVPSPAALERRRKADEAKAKKGRG